MSHTHSRSNSWLAVLVVTLASITVLGCSEQSKGPGGGDPRPSELAPSTAMGAESPAADPTEEMDYDPWERFNEKTFWLNYNVLDRYAFKPVATAWQKILPNQVRQSLANAFYNVAMPKRLVNEVLQARFREAGSEVARFLFNTTFGVAGLFDVASRAGLEKNVADTGQTLGVYGAGAGPYIVLPVLPPLTVRDGIGYGIDSVLDPLGWLITPFAADLGQAGGKTVNDRANNLKFYQDVEETSLDLYAAVRNGYLQRRQKSIEDAIRQRQSESFFARDGEFGQQTAENQAQIRP